MKVCNTCKCNKPETEYSWKNKSKGILSGKCKACHSKYVAEHYRKNKEAYNSRAANNRPVYYAKANAYIIEYLKTHPCVDCGNTDIRVLQFDHREMVGQQGTRVSNLKSSYQKMIREIKKCDVRCANCHMIRTFEQMGWTHRGPVV